jgi:hypothetical protein
VFLSTTTSLYNSIRPAHAVLTTFAAQIIGNNEKKLIQVTVARLCKRLCNRLPMAVVTAKWPPQHIKEKWEPKGDMGDQLCVEGLLMVAF